MANPRICSVEGCDKPVRVKSRGWCNAHWIRWSRYGDPLIGQRLRDEALRYLTDMVLHHVDEAECLFWPYTRTTDGYGCIGMGGRRVAVHRYVCEQASGAPPTPKHEAAHSCGSGHLGCVNPNHLSWKTRAENFADKLIHDTHNRGERNGAAKLTETDVRRIRSMAGAMTQRQIADEIGCSISNVRHILRGDSWSWL